MTKSNKKAEEIEQLLANPWAVDIEKLWQQAAHNPDKDLRKRITSTSRRYFNALRSNEKHKPVKNAENYLYGTMQNLFGVWWNKQANEKYRATHPDNFQMSYKLI